MTGNTDDNDLSTWERAKLNFWRMMYADTDEQLDETIREPANDIGKTDNPWFGLLVNGSTALIGLIVFIVFSGIVAYVGAFFAIVSVLSIVRWVLGL